MRRTAKGALEFLLVRTGFAGVWRAIRPRRALIIAYHNVVPAEDPRWGDSSLHLPLDEFQGQLDLLEKHFRVVPLHELLAGGKEGPEPMAAITFDDAYGGAIELGIPEIVRRGLSATVFVSPGLLGKRGFWWDLISDDRIGSIESEVRERALWALGGRQAAILHGAGGTDSHPASLPSLYRPATEEEVRKVGLQPGVFLGSHTWSHVNLAAVPQDEAVSEMKRSFDWLRDLPSFRSIISYPYGCWKAGLEPLAQAAGYEFGLMIQGGLSAPPIGPDSRFSVPRLNIPRGLSSNGFLARASGVWPK